MTSTPVENWRSNASPKRDWLCQQETCRTSNFGARFACRRCNYPRHGVALTLHDARRRDWYCQASQCFEFNFANRKECRKCGVERCQTPSETQFVSRTEM